MKRLILSILMVGSVFAQSEDHTIIYDKLGGYSLAKKQCRVIMREKDNIVQIAVITRSTKRQMKMTIDAFESAFNSPDKKGNIKLVTDSGKLLADFGKAYLKTNSEGEVKSIQLETNFPLNYMYGGPDSISCFKLDQ